MKTKITTKAGDDGETSLYSGERVLKSSERIRIVGLIDELVSYIGLARVSSNNEEVKFNLEKVQKDLFTLAAEIATTDTSKLKNKIDKKFMSEFEILHESISDKIEFPKDFILPGAHGSISGAQIDICRTIARKIEVEVTNFLLISKTCLKYLNRLSDFLWLLARLEEGNSKMQKD